MALLAAGVFFAAWVASHQAPKTKLPAHLRRRILFVYYYPTPYEPARSAQAVRVYYDASGSSVHRPAGAA